MLNFYQKYAKNFTFSQNGEEGILIECLDRMMFHVNKGHAVEIGGHDGRFCSNTALLLSQHGWSGLFVEYSYDLHLQSKANWVHCPNVRHQCCKVDERNINAFVDDTCDLLSIDLDGPDYKVFQGLQAKPKIVIIEVDSSIPPGVYDRNADGACGYSEMLDLGISKGFFLLSHTGNMVFVSDEYRHLFPEIVGDGVSNSELYFNRSWVKE